MLTPFLLMKQQHDTYMHVPAKDKDYSNH